MLNDKRHASSKADPPPQVPPKAVCAQNVQTLLVTVQPEQMQIRIDQTEEFVLPASHKKFHMNGTLCINLGSCLIGYRINLQRLFINKGAKLEAAVYIKKAYRRGRRIRVAQGYCIKVVRRKELGKRSQGDQHDHHQSANDRGFAAAEALPN